MKTPVALKPNRSQFGGKRSRKTSVTFRTTWASRKSEAARRSESPAAAISRQWAEDGLPQLKLRANRIATAGTIGKIVRAVMDQLKKIENKNVPITQRQR